MKNKDLIFQEQVKNEKKIWGTKKYESFKSELGTPRKCVNHLEEEDANFHDTRYLSVGNTEYVQTK